MPNTIRTRTSTKKSRAGVHSSSAKKIVKSCTINRQPAELYQFWKRPENLLLISRHILAVDRVSPTESHWRVMAPGNREVEWDAVIINEHENELLAWESKPGAEVQNAGSVRFNEAPGGQGTEVTVAFEFVPPGGIIGAAVAKLSSEDPELQVEEDLLRFKAYMETGEIPTIQGQSTGPGKAERSTK